MTTRADRIKRKTFDQAHTADLAAAHAEAREQWMKAAAETAGELRAFADFLHELDVPGLEVLADDLAAERMAETQEWPSFPDAAEWPELAEHLAGADERAKLPKQPDDMAELRRRADPDGPLLDWLNQGPADDENRPGRKFDKGGLLARGWTPQRRPDVILGELMDERFPADYGPLPALATAVEGTYTTPGMAVDHGAVDRWLQRTEQRLRQSSFGRWLAERFTPVKEEQS